MSACRAVLMNRNEKSSDKCDLHIRKRCRSRCNHINYQAPAPPSGGSPTKSSLFEILLALDSPTSGQESNAVYGDDKESIDFQKVVDLALHYSGSNAKATGS